jgi:hypothetical protein
VTSPVFPVFVSATQVNAIMPSSVTPGLASLRLFYNGTKSNAIPVLRTVSSPGVFAVSSAGYGPAVAQNFVTAANQPVNSSITPIVPGGTITIWGTGLGPVPYADNIAPTAGNIGSSVSVTVGGQPATLFYAGRSPFSLFEHKKMQLMNWADGLPTNIVQKGLTPSLLALSTQQAVAPPDPSIIILDGLSGDVLRFNLLTGTVGSSVAPPQTAQSPMAIRPSGQLVDDEVWIANGSSQLWVLNMATQTVVANIATASVPSLALPAGIVFTNDGATAIEPFRFLSADAAGNSGVLVVIDAAARKVTSTLPLKFRVATVAMAPDGLTAYLLSHSGQLTYYDVLSGTADLSVSTYAPGSGGGYNGVSNVFIHPDGTRLFWAVGHYLETFDLTRRKVTAEFNSGLPTTSAIALEVSQDGKTATLSNGLGSVVVMENTLRHHPIQRKI